EELVEYVETRGLHRLAAVMALWQVAAQLLAAGLEVLDLRAVLGGTVELEVDNLLLLERDVEELLEALHLLILHLLQVVGHVLGLASRAEAIALDRLGEDH